MTPELRDQLLALVEERQQHAKVQKAAEKEVERLTKEIKDLQAFHNLTSVDLGQWVTELQVGSRTSIRADLLLAAGVSPETIKEATEETPYTKLLVKERKVQG
jgi:hypothetical protein